MKCRNRLVSSTDTNSSAQTLSTTARPKARRTSVVDIFTMVVAGFACLRGASAMAPAPASFGPAPYRFGSREGVNMTVDTYAFAQTNVANVSLATTNRGNALLVSAHPNHGWTIDVLPRQAAGIGVFAGIDLDVTKPGIGPRSYPFGVADGVNLTVSTVPLEDAHQQTASLLFESVGASRITIDDGSGAWRIQSRPSNDTTTQVRGALSTPGQD